MLIVSRGLGAVDHQRGIISPLGEVGRVSGVGGGRGAGRTFQESSQLISQLIKSGRSAQREINQSGSERRDGNLKENGFNDPLT